MYTPAQSATVIKVIMHYLDRYPTPQQLQDMYTLDYQQYSEIVDLGYYDQSFAAYCDELVSDSEAQVCFIDSVADPVLTA